MPQFEISQLTLLLLQMAAILAACRLLGKLAAAIGQPQVIAEVTAGILLGPSLLGWISPEGMNMLFPAESMPILRMLSQVGLVLFMFLVGLEFDPKLLRGRTQASILISHTSIVFPFILGIGAAWWLYDGYNVDGVSWLSFGLFLGVAMSVTAFPVLARILSERNLLSSRLGAIAIACAAVDDVTAWCLLAFVVAIANASGLSQAVWTTGFSLAFIAVMFFVVQPFLKRIAESIGSSEEIPSGILVVTLLLLLLSSAATEFIGIHALFGAFLFGAILPKSGSFAESLANKLETVAVMLLLPLFFAYSGLRTEIGLISGKEEWIVTIVIILLATLGKFGGSVAAARFTGLRWREAGAIGILMNTRGLMELVVLNIGMDLGVISPTIFTMMVIMALVTTFATTPILALVYPDRELARDRVDDSSSTSIEVVKPWTLMMTLSSSVAGPGMVTLAKALTGKSGANSRIFALHLRQPSERASLEMKHHGQNAGSNPVMAPLLARANEINLEVRSLGFVSVDPAADIVRTADAKLADMLLLGAHKPLLLESPFSGTVSDVLESSSQITGILFDKGLKKVQKLLVYYTDSRNDTAMDVIVERLKEQNDAEVTFLEHSTDSASFIELTKKHDLVVIGAPDQKSTERGSASRRIRAMLSDCPISILAIAAPSSEQSA